jgi:hypothetical protein
MIRLHGGVVCWLPQVEALRTAEGRLSMYVKRCNSSWAEVQTWQPPDLWGQEEVDIWLQVGA